jgi:hypothetical protein
MARAQSGIDDPYFSSIEQRHPRVFFMKRRPFPTPITRTASKGDASGVVLIFVIACLSFAYLLLSFPDVDLTVDQLNSMPLFGP